MDPAEGPFGHWFFCTYGRTPSFKYDFLYFGKDHDHCLSQLWLENNHQCRHSNGGGLFQPELRKALEQLGSQNLISGILAFDDGKEEAAFTERTANEIVKATFEMAKVKTGALMVLERNMPLKEIERT